KSTECFFLILRFSCFFVTNLFLAGSGSLGIVAVTARVALTDACGLTAQSTQVVELRASDATTLYEIDMVDDRRVQRENSFDADAETGFSHCDRFARAAMFAGDDDAFKSLQSLFGLGLFNPHVYTDRIAWLKLWNIITQLRLFNFVQSIHCSMLLKIRSNLSASQDAYAVFSRLQLPCANAQSLRDCHSAILPALSFP